MRLVFLFFSTILMACNCSKQAEQHKFDYPGLGMIVDAYYRDYYDYPKTTDDLLLFIEASEFPKNYDATINKLKNNRGKIGVKHEMNTLVITLGNKAIYETPLRSPCDELSYNIGFYLGKVLFFNEDGLSITSKEFSNEFRSGMRTIVKHYDKIKKEGDTNKYVLVKYVRSEGLTLFCNENIRLKDYGYFKEVERYLNVFSKKYQVNRIIFTTPVFYK